MLVWAALLLMIAIIAASVGLSGLAAGADGPARLLFVVFLILFALSLIAGVIQAT